VIGLLVIEFYRGWLSWGMVKEGILFFLGLEPLVSLKGALG